MKLSRRDYNQNNYSGMAPAPAPGLLANDSHNTDGSLLLCVHITGHLCFCVPAGLPTFARWPKTPNQIVAFCKDEQLSSESCNDLPDYS